MRHRSRLRCYGCGKDVVRGIATCDHCGAVQTQLCEGCGGTVSIYEEVCPFCCGELRPKSYRPTRRIPRWPVAVLVLLALGYGAYRFFPRDPEKVRLKEYQEALDAFQAKRYDEARILFARYLKEHGEYPPARYMEGASRYWAGHEAEGVRSVAKAFGEDPSLDEAAEFLALNAYKKGDLSAALRYARQAIAIRPGALASHLVAGKVLSRPGYLDVEKAMWHLRKAVEGGIQDPEGCVLLAELTVAVNLSSPEAALDEKAKRLIEKARGITRGLLQENPDRGDLLLFLARCCYLSGDLSAAGVYVTKARLRKVESPGLDLLQAKIEWDLGNPTGAKLATDRLLSGKPDPTVLLELGDFYRGKGQSGPAARVLAAARARFPGDETVILWTARALRDEGDMAASERVLRKGLELHPGSSLISLALADVLMRNRRGSLEAERIIRNQVRMPGVQPGAWLRLADICLDTPEEDPRYEARIAEARKILENPRTLRKEWDPWASYRGYLHAKLLFTERRYREALEVLSKVASRDPRYLPSHLLLARIHRIEGEGRLAAQELSAAIDIRGVRPDLLLERCRTYLSMGRDSLSRAEADARDALKLAPASEEARLLLARIQLAKSPPGIDAAIQVLQEALRKPQATVRPRILLGRALLRAKRFNEAEKELKQAEEAAQDPEERYNAVAALADLRDTQQHQTLSPPARKTIEEYLLKEPGDLKGRIRYAAALLRKGDRDAARVWADSVLKTEPGNRTAILIAFETCFAEQGTSGSDRKRAEALLATMSRLEPGGPRELYMKGKLALVDGRTEAATKLLREARARAPRDPRVTFFLGRALYESGQLKEARLTLEDCLREAPHLLSARLLLAEIAFRQGSVLLQRGAPVEATRDFQYALRMNGDSLPAMELLAWSTFQSVLRGLPADLDEAREGCRRLISELEAGHGGLPKEERDRTLLRANLLLGGICQVRGDWRGVVDTCDAVLHIRPDAPGVMLRKGFALLKAGQPRSAVDVLRTVLNRQPGDWLLVSILADAYGRIGQPDKGLQLIEGWASAHPGDANARAFLGWHLLQAGRGDRAQKVFQQALELDPSQLEAALGISDLMISRGEYEAAAGLLRSLARKSRKKAGYMFLVGRVLLARDFSSREGMDLLLRALRSGIPDRRFHVWCAVVAMRALVRAGRIDDAVEVGFGFADSFRERGDPKEGSLTRDLTAEGFCLAGVALALKGQVDLAEHRYRKALQLRPGYEMAQNNLAEFLATRKPEEGGLKEALALSRSAVKADPAKPEYRDTLGFVLLRSGKAVEALAEFSEAERLFRAALAKVGDARERARLGSALAATLVRRSRAHLAKGDVAAARQDLDQALAADASVAGTAEYRSARAALANR